MARKVVEQSAAVIEGELPAAGRSELEAARIDLTAKLSPVPVTITTLCSRSAPTSLKQKPSSSRAHTLQTKPPPPVWKVIVRLPSFQIRCPPAAIVSPCRKAWPKPDGRPHLVP